MPGARVHHGAAQQGPRVRARIVNFSGVCNSSAAGRAAGYQDASVRKNRCRVSGARRLHDRRGGEISIRAEKICAGNRSIGAVAANNEHPPILQPHGRRTRTHVSHGVRGLPGSGGDVGDGGGQDEDAGQDEEGKKPIAFAQAHLLCLPIRNCLGAARGLPEVDQGEPTTGEGSLVGENFSGLVWSARRLPNPRRAGN